MIHEKTKEFLCRLILMNEGGREGMVHPDRCDDALRRSALDWLYVSLGVFTYIYLALVAIVFFGHFEQRLAELFWVLRTFEGVYIAALGVYVILKEIRKEHGRRSRYWGELFVAAWGLLLAAATAAVLISPAYVAGRAYALIVSTSFVVILIYIGSLIHKP